MTWQDNIIYRVQKSMEDDLKKRLAEVCPVLQKVATGDFSVRVDIPKVKDEMTELLVLLNRMIDDLQEVSEKVKAQTSRIITQKHALEDQHKAFLNILEDVREEKVASQNLAGDLEKFKLAVENASDHIVITDKSGTILYANKAVEKTTGYSLEEVIGKKAGTKDLWGGQMGQAFYEKMWETIGVKKEVFLGDFTNKKKWGEQYIARASISPVLDKNGDVKFFVGIERDVTMEKKVDQAKTEFVSIASHQLRTPLSTIKWYVELLQDGSVGPLNQEQKNFLHEISIGNERMVEFVNALLNVSRIEVGSFVVEPEPVNLIEFMKDEVHGSKPQIDIKKLKIKTDFDPSLPIINLDPKLMRIVVTNLLSNSVKYTPEGGTITLGLKKQKNGILFSISDTGMGIPMGQQSKIFTKMFRADNVKAADTHGTGLGLYIVKSIVEESHGKIWFESKENKGTTFYVTLPLGGMKKKTGSKKLN